MLTLKQQNEMLLAQRNLLVGTLNEVLAHNPGEGNETYIRKMLRLCHWPPVEELEK